jgi:hypothetical protein
MPCSGGSQASLAPWPQVIQDSSITLYTGFHDGVLPEVWHLMFSMGMGIRTWHPNCLGSGTR